MNAERLLPLGDLHEHDEDCMCLDCQERDLVLADQIVEQLEVDLDDPWERANTEGPFYGDAWVYLGTVEFDEIRNPLLCTEESCS